MTITHRLGLLAAAWAAICGSTTVHAQTAPTPATAIHVANESKSPIVAVYVSPAGRVDWSDDMLGKGKIGPGKSAKLTLKTKPTDCKVDFSAMLDNGDTRIKKDIDLCAAAPAVGF
jgi:P pilus assembly chaperone PapD